MVARAEKTDALDMTLQGSKRRRRAAIREFFPNRGVLLISKGKTTTVPAGAVSPDTVGLKAFGLSCLPSEWVPGFFVVDTSGVVGKREYAALEVRIADCLANLNLVRSVVFVRSSGITETVEQRGQLVSAACASSKIMKTIRQLSAQLAKRKIKNAYWIIQAYVHPAGKGHLSNERRLSREPRDFVAECEPNGERPGYAVPVAVRHWRDGGEVTNFDLSCTSETGATLRLKRVALWAAGLPSRALFEWIWDGTGLWIVQADLAPPVPGVNPNTLYPKHIQGTPTVPLRAFRLVGRAECEKYPKLSNTLIYEKFGYQMPTFYILDDPKIIRRILKGRITKSVDHDLQVLTCRPLIIRTDGSDIPRERREMLPRSEGLRTSTQAREWLIGEFSGGVARLAIPGVSLCLIAHHFIPSIAAAWARYEPGDSTVRIESLWGLPEGLYWHSHDTFEVDTEQNDRTRERLRFKGTFFAPDEAGRWVHYRPNLRFDWGRSIARKQWLSEIAKTTRSIAEFEKHAVAVMWFVDNDPRATPHKVLPWYHTESAIGALKAAPRRKLMMASDVTIETIAQWQVLKSSVQAGKRIERVTLEPKDPELVRNPQFARELAQFAADNKIVIELAGGVLSHAYHILQWHGAQVECIDLFGAESEDVEYNKLVRDIIPDLIQRKGERVEIIRLTGEALLAALRQKLVEESFEALDAKGDDLIGELADLLETTQAICDSLGVPAAQLEAEREEKRRRRGGFRRGLMLKRTSTPHTLAKIPESINATFPTDAAPEIELIERVSEIPAKRPYSRPDLRNVDQHPEVLLTFQTEPSKLGTAKHSTLFHVPIGEDESRSFTVSVELTRRRSSLWGQVRVRLDPLQMSMKLTPDSQMELKFPQESGAGENQTQANKGLPKDMRKKR